QLVGFAQLADDLLRRVLPLSLHASSSLPFRAMVELSNQVDQVPGVTPQGPTSSHHGSPAVAVERGR
ncbi:MAG TPA: hypothetical protein VNE42_00625, partial [Acidimicrobiales bacterium]|nr:hypothetical protein [Acidimicrobiales bacterium]